MQTAEERREREKKYKKETYEYCKRIGICVRCRKEDAFYNHVLCPTCIEYRTTHQSRRREDMTEEKRIHLNELKRQRYYRNKEAGLCVNCGKPAAEGKTLCMRCDVQAKRAGANYRLRNGIKKGWAESGLCIRCGAEPIEGKKLCPVCMEKNRKSMAYARQFAPGGRPWER